MDKEEARKIAAKVLNNLYSPQREEEKRRLERKRGEEIARQINEDIRRAKERKN